MNRHDGNIVICEVFIFQLHVGCNVLFKKEQNIYKFWSSLKFQERVLSKFHECSLKVALLNIFLFN